MQGWLTHSASPPARPAVWGFLSCSPAGGDTDLSPADGTAAVRRLQVWRPVCTHSEDSLRLSTGTHVGVMDLFEHHPGLVMFTHLWVNISNIMCTSTYTQDLPIHHVVAGASQPYWLFRRGFYLYSPYVVTQVCHHISEHILPIHIYSVHTSHMCL